MPGSDALPLSGPVRLDGNDRRTETAVFQRLVRPRLNPWLGSYFIGLTGRADGTFASSGLPVLLGFSPPMDAHRALGDARCVAGGCGTCRAPAAAEAFQAGTGSASLRSNALRHSAAGWKLGSWRYLASPVR